MPMLSYSRLLIKTSFPLFALTFLKTLLNPGLPRFSHGSSTESNPTRISTPRLVRLITRCCGFLLIILGLSGPSESEIRMRLTLEEESDGLTSTVIESVDDFTETKYLLYGLDLEERQYVLSVVRCVCGTNVMLGANYESLLRRPLPAYRPPQLSNFGPPSVVISSSFVNYKHSTSPRLHS